MNPTEQSAAVTATGGWPGAASSPVQVLRVRDRDAERNVPLTELDGVIECPPVTPVPAAPAWLLGVATHKGSLMPIVDLSAACGEAQTHSRRPADRLLLVETGIHRIAFSVDAILSQGPETAADHIPTVKLRALSAHLIDSAFPAGRDQPVVP